LHTIAILAFGASSLFLSKAMTKIAVGIVICNTYILHNKLID
jgi:hypothetical protein